MVERSNCGSGGCVTCPFSYSEEAMQAQDYGCLPDKLDIVRMKEMSGHNWACHGDDKVLCGGFSRYLTNHRPDLDVKTGGLISYSAWSEKGESAAISEAQAVLDRPKKQDLALLALNEYDSSQKSAQDASHLINSMEEIFGGENLYVPVR